MPLSTSRLLADSQISPPHVRVPITVPSPSRRNPSANASPSDAVNSSQSTTMWPRKAYCMFQHGVADARLPEEPGLAQQLFEDPAVDVAAAIVADVDDQALAREDRVELALPLGDVAAAHRPQVDVADLALAGFLHGLTACELPFVVAEIVFRVD